MWADVEIRESKLDDFSDLDITVVSGCSRASIKNVKQKIIAKLENVDI